MRESMAQSIVALLKVFRYDCQSGANERWGLTSPTICMEMRRIVTELTKLAGLGVLIDRRDRIIVTEHC